MTHDTELHNIHKCRFYSPFEGFFPWCSINTMTQKGDSGKKGRKGEPERVINFPNISSEDV